ncbi:hypothetical protein PRZ48_003379 [Zasmidium cellare]|uniref:Glycoside hydrolase family 28 protein n=1 Tax=Zasmidium cellare TaxID=395010 RepID=A0ABR0EWF1_ZASCE|nr:hypothetical protein PRZ48_003379 [Zasmidium cellare]
MHNLIATLAVASAALQGVSAQLPARTNICYVSQPSDGSDAVPNILHAFDACGTNGKIYFLDSLYNISTVMDTYLSNVEVNIEGTLLWSTNIDYWVKNSLPVGYLNQSTAWIFGGDNVLLQGYNKGTFNGSGQVWYESIVAYYDNYPGRPHQITFGNLTNSVVGGMRFVQSQMWTMSIINSSNLLLESIYVNNTNSIPGAQHPQNTDGADTLFSNNITFNGWTVDNGDDSISCKANSTNILIQNCTFYHGNGIAMGSIGQCDNQINVFANVTARDIVFNGAAQAVYIKTWAGIPSGNPPYPPNSGGGGLGYIKNLTFTNFTVNDIGQGKFAALSIQQCYQANQSIPNICDSSKMQISDVSWSNIQGTMNNSYVAALQCSGAVPCPGISIENVDLTVVDTGKLATGYLCSNVSNPIGFTCTGVPRTH